MQILRITIQYSRECKRTKKKNEMKIYNGFSIPPPNNTNMRNKIKNNESESSSFVGRCLCHISECIAKIYGLK